MHIRRPEAGDRAAYLAMRSALWPDSHEDHAREIDDYLSSTSRFVDQVFVCVADEKQVVGFVELRIRNYAEGSENTEVPYVEGWYVEAPFRGRGVGALLMARAQVWARENGFRELASDAEIDNHASIAAHQALGFDETDRIVCFLKKF